MSKKGVPTDKNVQKTPKAKPSNPNPGYTVTHPLNPTQLKKQALLIAMRTTLCNITVACQKAGVDRGTYYDWMKADPAFNKAVQEAYEARLDAWEAILSREAVKGNMTAVIFGLKCQGKARGWVERTEVDFGAKGSGGLKVELDKDTLKRIAESFIKS
jgi:hypothetical protein